MPVWAVEVRRASGRIGSTNAWQSTRWATGSNLARIADQANLDMLFFGDVLGFYDVFGGNADAAMKWAVEAPANDPLMIIPALAAVTETLRSASRSPPAMNTPSPTLGASAPWTTSPTGGWAGTS